MNLSKLPKDLLVAIGLDLNLPTLLNYCLISKRFNDLTCNNFSFWYNKLYKDYGFKYSGNKTVEDIKNYYQRISWLDINGHLIEAAKLGDKELIEDLIKQGADSFVSASYKAIRGGYMDVFNVLLSKAPYLSDYFDNFLRVATYEGHRDLVKYFIDQGAKDWEGGLHAATEGGHMDLVEYFMSKGAKDLNNALEGAARGGQKDLIDFFIQKGASDWNRGLSAAAASGYKDLVNFFIERSR